MNQMTFSDYEYSMRNKLNVLFAYANLLMVKRANPKKQIVPVKG